VKSNATLVTDKNNYGTEQPHMHIKEHIKIIEALAAPDYLTAFCFMKKQLFII